MNTKQLIALWYTGIVLVLGLFIYDSMESDLGVAPLLSAILVAGLLVAYSLGNYPNVDKRALAKWVGSLVLCITLAYGARGLLDYKDKIEWQAHRRQLMENVELSDVTLDSTWDSIRRAEEASELTLGQKVNKQLFSDSPIVRDHFVLTGKIVNNSDSFVDFMYIRLQLLNEMENAIFTVPESLDFNIPVRITPPGGTTEFSHVFDCQLPKDVAWTWSYELEWVSGPESPKQHTQSTSSGIKTLRSGS